MPDSISVKGRAVGDSCDRQLVLVYAERGLTLEGKCRDFLSVQALPDVGHKAEAVAKQFLHQRASWLARPSHGRPLHRA